MFENLRAASTAGETALAEAQAKFLAVSTGCEEGTDSLQDQLMGKLSLISLASLLMAVGFLHLKTLMFFWSRAPKPAASKWPFL